LLSLFLFDKDTRLVFYGEDFLLTHWYYNGYGYIITTSNTTSVSS